MILRARDRYLDFSKPYVMGILNATPDSFSDGGTYLTLTEQQKQVLRLIEDGADIIDIGGQSTRPGALRIEWKEEWERIRPILTWTLQETDAVVSVDTYYPEVAELSLDAGAHIINDVLFEQPDMMFRVVQKYHAAYVLMHHQGTPATMQLNPHYQDVVSEVYQYFLSHIAMAHTNGVQDIILDPGFGFGKTLQHNYELLNNLSIFRLLGKPILVGISRKSMVTKPFGKSWQELQYIQEILHAKTFEFGATLFRVHEPQKIKNVLRLYQEFFL